MDKDKTVAVVMGGPSAEEQISLSTGHAMAAALQGKGYNVKEIRLVPHVFSEQVKEFRPKVATIASPFDGIVDLEKYSDISVGETAFTDAIIEDADVVVVALVGFTGIVAVLSAIDKGKDIALANK